MACNALRFFISFFWEYGCVFVSFIVFVFVSGFESFFQSIPMSLLWELCRLGDVEAVKAALARGEDVNHRLDDKTMLMFVVTKCSSDNHVEVLRLLLEHPATEVNVAAEPESFTALHVATQQAVIIAIIVRVIIMWQNTRDTLRQ